MKPRSTPVDPTQIARNEAVRLNVEVPVNFEDVGVFQTIVAPNGPVAV